ncbi:6379_t:CDS:2, partial [Entrophospora sp. SA101]
TINEWNQITLRQYEKKKTIEKEWFSYVLKGYLPNFRIFANRDQLYTKIGMIGGLQELESKKSYRLTNNDPINYRFNKFLGKAAGTIFALSLLIAGQVQHFAATIAGQVVQAMMEELISWKNVRPWTQDGFNSMLVASQVALSIQLPFAVIPLIYFTKILYE